MGDMIYYCYWYHHHYCYLSFLLSLSLSLLRDISYIAYTYIIAEPAGKACQRSSIAKEIW